MKHLFIGIMMIAAVSWEVHFYQGGYHDTETEIVVEQEEVVESKPVRHGFPCSCQTKEK